jgi:hypothetical protein
MHTVAIGTDDLLGFSTPAVIAGIQIVAFNGGQRVSHEKLLRAQRTTEGAFY